jgi:hypothetical protein
METVLVWLLRAIGLLWIAGGAFGVHSAGFSWRLGRMTNNLEAVRRDLDPEALQDETPDDTARDLWLLAGAGLTFLTGCALVAASRLALPLCLLLLVHQLFYFARQARRSRRSGDEADAVAPSTRNAALFALFVTACVVFLTVSGAYG